MRAKIVTPIKYNKLVRDLIPDIIREDGWVPTTSILGADQHIVALKAKLIEESSEYIGGANAEELVDILEVVLCLALIGHGIGQSDLLEMTEAKRTRRDSLREGIRLLEITAP